MSTMKMGVEESRSPLTIQLTLSYLSGWWTAACPSIGVAARNRDRYKALIEVENHVLRTEGFLGLPAKALRTSFGMAAPAAKRAPARPARVADNSGRTAGAANSTARKPGRPRKALNPVGSMA